MATTAATAPSSACAKLTVPLPAPHEHDADGAEGVEPADHRAAQEDAGGRPAVEDGVEHPPQHEQRAPTRRRRGPDAGQRAARRGGERGHRRSGYTGGLLGRPLAVAEAPAAVGLDVGAGLAVAGRAHVAAPVHLAGVVDERVVVGARGAVGAVEERPVAGGVVRGAAAAGRV